MNSQESNQDYVFGQLTSFINSDLKGNREEAKEVLDQAIGEIKDAIEKFPSNKYNRELLEFAEGRHPYYSQNITQGWPQGLRLVFCDVHSDGLHPEVFTQFVKVIKNVKIEIIKEVEEKKDLDEIPLLHMFLEKNLGEAEDRGVCHRIKESNIKPEDHSSDSLRYQAILDKEAFSFQSAEGKSFFQGLNTDQNHTEDFKSACLRILEGNFQMIHKIQNKMLECSQKNYPLNFVLLCGQQHAGGIAKLLGANAIFASRNQLNNEEARTFQVKHDVSPIYAPRKNCGDSLTLADDGEEKKSIDEKKIYQSDLTSEISGTSVLEQFSPEASADPTSSVDAAKTTDIKHFCDKLCDHLALTGNLKEFFVDQLQERGFVLTQIPESSEELSTIDENFSLENDQNESPEDPSKVDFKCSFNSYIRDIKNHSRKLFNIANEFLRKGKMSVAQNYLEKALYFLDFNGLIPESELDPKKHSVISAAEIRIQNNIIINNSSQHLNKNVLIIDSDQFYFEKLGILNQLALLLYQSGRTNEALAQKNKAIKIEREKNGKISVKSVCFKVNLLHEIQRFSEAEGLLNEAQLEKLSETDKLRIDFAIYQNLRFQKKYKRATEVLFGLKEPFDPPTGFLIENEKVNLLLTDKSGFSEALKIFQKMKEHFENSKHSSDENFFNFQENHRKVIKTGALFVEKFQAPEVVKIKDELSWCREKAVAFLKMLGENRDRREATYDFLRVLGVSTIKSE